MSFIVATCEAVAPYVRKDQLIVLESTTYPGTTVEVMVPILERTGLKVDRDFSWVFSRAGRPSRTDYTTETIPKSSGRQLPRACNRGEGLPADRGAHVPVSSRRLRSTKLVENTFRAVNIALMNELK